MVSAIKPHFTAHWLAGPKVVGLCALFPLQLSSQTLKVPRDYTKSQVQPSSLDMFYDHDIFCCTVSTQWMGQFLRMNSLQRKRVLAVQGTADTFQRIGGPVKNDNGSDNTNASYHWLHLDLHGPFVSHLIFTKIYWSDKSEVVISPFRMWKLRFTEVKWRQNNSQVFDHPDSLTKLVLRSATHWVHSLPAVEHFVLLKQCRSRLGAVSNCLLVSVAQWMTIKIRGSFLPRLWEAEHLLNSGHISVFRPVLLLLIIHSHHVWNISYLCVVRNHQKNSGRKEVCPPYKWRSWGLELLSNVSKVVWWRKRSISLKSLNLWPDHCF